MRWRTRAQSHDDDLWQNTQSAKLPKSCFAETTWELSKHLPGHGLRTTIGRKIGLAQNSRPDKSREVSGDTPSASGCQTNGGDNPRAATVWSTSRKHFVSTDMMLRCLQMVRFILCKDSDPPSIAGHFHMVLKAIASAPAPVVFFTNRPGLADIRSGNTIDDASDPNCTPQKATKGDA